MNKQYLFIICTMLLTIQSSLFSMAALRKVVTTAVSPAISRTLRGASTQAISGEVRQNIVKPDVDGKLLPFSDKDLTLQAFDHKNRSILLRTLKPDTTKISTEYFDHLKSTLPIIMSALESIHHLKYSISDAKTKKIDSIINSSLKQLVDVQNPYLKIGDELNSIHQPLNTAFQNVLNTLIDYSTQSSRESLEQIIIEHAQEQIQQTAELKAEAPSTTKPVVDLK